MKNKITKLEFKNFIDESNKILNTLPKIGENTYQSKFGKVMIKIDNDYSTSKEVVSIFIRFYDYENLKIKLQDINIHSGKHNLHDNSIFRIINNFKTLFI